MHQIEYSVGSYTLFMWGAAMRIQKNGEIIKDDGWCMKPQQIGV
jgi:hypothetical protein